MEVGESEVLIFGVAFPTERVSEPQALSETPLLVSPL
jgi:hypothetical protein